MPMNERFRSRKRPVQRQGEPVRDHPSQYWETTFDTLNMFEHKPLLGSPETKRETEREKERERGRKTIVRRK